ncbi:MAG: hypothetical protein WCP93_02980 [Candidatus Berkelbacteria bacterium]
MKLLTKEEIQKMSHKVLVQNYRTALSSSILGSVGQALLDVSTKPANNNCKENIDLLEEELLSRLDSLERLKKDAELYDSVIASP